MSRVGFGFGAFLGAGPCQVGQSFIEFVFGPIKLAHCLLVGRSERLQQASQFFRFPVSLFAVSPNSASYKPARSHDISDTVPIIMCIVIHQSGRRCQ